MFPRGSRTHLDQKNMSFDALKQVRVTDWLPASPLPHGDTGQSQERSSLANNLSHKGKGERVNEHLASLAVWPAAKGDHFSLIPSLNCDLHDWGGVRGGERGNQNSQKTLKEQRYTKYVTGSINKPTHKLLGMPHPQIPINGKWGVAVLHLPHSNTLPTCGQLTIIVLDIRVSRLWLMPSEHVQKVGKTLGPEKDTKT